MCTTTIALLLSLSLATPPAGLIEVEPRTGNCPARVRSVMAQAAEAEDLAQSARDRAGRLERELAEVKSADRATTAWAVIGGVLLGGLVVGLAVGYGAD